MAATRQNAASKEAESKEINGLFIKSKSNRGFRRCGFRFSPEGVGVELDALTEEQIKILKSDPQLIVEDAAFSNE